MRFYFAPMEGITGFVYRNAYEACFKGSIDKYFAPFITAVSQRSVSPKDLRDIDPQQNEGLFLVPQILANRSEDFIRTAQAVKALGYTEINLNLGCPSKTVVTKKKGAGFLAYPELLDPFLDEVCQWSEKEGVRFSVKTRIGVYDEDEFPELLKIFNKYPLQELIIHPRTQTDYYNNTPRMEVFDRALAESNNSLCYNGDLSDGKKLSEFAKTYPQLDKVMIGRGFLTRPGMNIPKGENTWDTEQDDTFLPKLWELHDRVYEGYRQYIQGEKNRLFKMKELWFYMGQAFPQNNPVVKKSLKQIKKSQCCGDYESAVRMLRRF